MIFKESVDHQKNDPYSETKKETEDVSTYNRVLFTLFKIELCTQNVHERALFYYLLLQYECVVNPPKQIVSFFVD